MFDMFALEGGWRYRLGSNLLNRCWAGSDDRSWSALLEERHCDCVHSPSKVVSLCWCSKGRDSNQHTQEIVKRSISWHRSAPRPYSGSELCCVSVGREREVGWEYILCRNISAAVRAATAASSPTSIDYLHIRILHVWWVNASWAFVTYVSRLSDRVHEKVLITRDRAKWRRRRR